MGDLSCDINVCVFWTACPLLRQCACAGRQADFYYNSVTSFWHVLIKSFGLLCFCGLSEAHHPGGMSGPLEGRGPVAECLVLLICCSATPGAFESRRRDLSARECHLRTRPLAECERLPRRGTSLQRSASARPPSNSADLSRLTTSERHTARSKAERS